MDLDDEICYCYHVSLRKLLHFARRERPTHASQMSECLGAGSGCGWCIPVLSKIAACKGELGRAGLIGNPGDYAAGREAYRAARRGRTATRGEDDVAGAD